MMQLLPKNLEDPFDRLNDIEQVQLAQGLFLTDLSKQLKQQSQLGAKLSESLMELVHHIEVLGNKVYELECRIELLEIK